jgi:hypothetical protein
MIRLLYFRTANYELLESTDEISTFKPRPWWVGIIALGVVGIHSLMITLHSLPPEYTSNGFEWTSSYIYPQFYQNWRLFSPEIPKADGRIEWRYRTSGGVWSDWRPIDDDLSKAHRVLRLGYPGRVATGMHSILDLLCREAEKGEADGYEGAALIALVKNGWPYYMLRTTVWNRIKALGVDTAILGGFEMTVYYNMPLDLVGTRVSKKLFFQEFIK